MSGPKLGFIGFGEAAYHLASGLLEEGLNDITAISLDPRQLDGVKIKETHAATIEGRDIIISAVTARVATDVAKIIAENLSEGQIVMDINSVSPETKCGIADIINGAGGRFVEAAVMGGVPASRHKVPILLGGPAASEVESLLSPFGMNLTVLGPEYGRAAATKMFRSIMVKGLEALLQECVLGADKYGAADQVLASVGEGYPGVDWVHLADHLLGRTAVHGGRRADEMDEVAATLRQLGIEPLMASAAATRIRWAANHGLKEKFGNTPPESFHDVLAAIKNA